MELIWILSGVHQESIRSPSGVYQESIHFIRSPSGVYQEFTRSPSGVHQEYQDFIRTPDGVHQDAWGSVTYSFVSGSNQRSSHMKHQGGFLCQRWDRSRTICTKADHETCNFAVYL